ncbi:MAG: chromate efflux transporter [Gammaproteobacteria bacterium]|nr:chromate efflux transporter [Gammaproteobacteria bacterium]
MNPAEAPAAPTFSQALGYWLRLGFISFGGPAGQIAIMHQELVEKRRWISERRFLHALNYCMVLPGPEAQQLATYIGWLLHGARGGIAAGALFVLPSLFILIGLSWLYMAYGDVPAVAGVLYGIKPAVVAIVLFAAYRIGNRALRHAALWLIAGGAFLAIFALHLPFPWIVLGAGLLGALGGRLAPGIFAHGGHGPPVDKSFGPAVIDDATPAPAHARFSPPRLVRGALAGLLLMALPYGLLIAWQGAQGLPARMAGFFTAAALVTFGGAYAVLPFVYQAAVEKFGWLSATQMIDGLALGETTPGPLIMVVAFVGFVAGWGTPPPGVDAPFWSGVLGACVATYYTFLPSFLFIFAGAPLVEATHGDLKFTAPLTAITAAVVGVIVNLALFFAWHVFWPAGFAGAFDPFPAAVALAALVALIRYRAGVIPLIAACAAAGVLKTLFLIQP